MDTKIVVFKIGLEVIAQIEHKVSDLGKPIICLKNPVRCQIAPAAQGDGTALGFGAILPIMAEKQTIEASADDILFTAEPIPEIREAYDATFGCGIITASSNVLNKLQLSGQ